MKRVLVTGANRGIGFAIAEGLSKKGYEVFVGARDAEAGQQAADKIQAKSILIDVANSASIEAAVKELGYVDVLVNNAGVLGSGNVLDSRKDFEEAMAVKL